MNRPLVSIARNTDISVAVVEAMEKLSLPDLNGKKILLKPNVGRDVGPRLAINTNPDVVAAVFHFLREKFDATFYIGDSPIISTDTHKAFEHSGFAPLLQEEGLKFLDLDSPPAKTLSIPNGRVIKQIKVTGYWDEIDYIVSIPVLKMHMHTGASLSFKNCKGLLYGREKIKLHHLEDPEAVKKYTEASPPWPLKELDIAIADLADVIRPDLVVIDASQALAGMGPSSGTAIRMDIIIASTNFVAADLIALGIAQPNWVAGHVPHLKLIAERGGDTGITSLDEIDTIPSDITPFITQIEGPPTSISIKYDNVVLHDIESCSACLSTVFLFLKENKEFIDKHFSKENPLSLGIGKGLMGIDLYEPTFLIGNCTANRRNDGFFIRGCTPVQSVIKTEIEEFIKKKNDK